MADSGDSLRFFKYPYGWPNTCVLLGIAEPNRDDFRAMVSPRSYGVRLVVPMADREDALADTLPSISKILSRGFDNPAHHIATDEILFSYYQDDTDEIISSYFDEKKELFLVDRCQDILLHSSLNTSGRSLGSALDDEAAGSTPDAIGRFFGKLVRERHGAASFTRPGDYAPFHIITPSDNSKINGGTRLSAILDEISRDYFDIDNVICNLHW